MARKFGFTLLELVIAMAIISVVMMAVFAAFSIALRLFVEESNRTDIFIEADRAMSKMTSELRSSRQIVSSSSREVIFWLADSNSDGTREAAETVRFSWSGALGANLLRAVSFEVIPLAYGVYDFCLTYDDPGAPKLVNIRLSVGKQSTFTTLESSVKLRNL